MVSPETMTERSSARACDSCRNKRARLYCAADDAFLCQICDSAVHSANPLARRHHRVRLKSADVGQPWHGARMSEPAWHKGFVRKARSPRGKRRAGETRAVPEAGGVTPEYHEQLILYRVPTGCDPDDDKAVDDFPQTGHGHESGGSVAVEFREGMDLLSEMGINDFTAEVESLGKQLDDETWDIEGLGFLDCSLGVKMEEEEEEEQDKSELGPEPMVFDRKPDLEESEVGLDQRRMLLLRLDYENVQSAWNERRSPWMAGERPVISSGEWRWPGYMVERSMVADEGREARVSRYREKRRTRLFSKKIRYQVRKINAEKRPRIKGRGVAKEDRERTAFLPTIMGYNLLGSAICLMSLSFMIISGSRNKIRYLCERRKYYGLFAGLDYGPYVVVLLLM